MGLKYLRIIFQRRRKIILESTDNILCTICDDNKSVSPALTCKHKYCKECIEHLQKYKQGDFIDEYKHQCPECRKPLILNPLNVYHSQIINRNKTLNTKYVRKDYYRFCLVCNKLINSGTKSCQIERSTLRPYCFDCDPLCRTQECKCGAVLEWYSGCQKVKCPKCLSYLCFIHNKTEYDIEKRLKIISTSNNKSDKCIYNNLLTLPYYGSYVYLRPGTGYLVYVCPWCAEDNLLYHRNTDPIEQFKIRATNIVMELNKKKYMNKYVNKYQLFITL